MKIAGAGRKLTPGSLHGASCSTDHAGEQSGIFKNPQHLFECWSQVAERVRSAGRVALFLDFDGTLAPFRARPEDVTLSNSTRRVLGRLANHPQLRLFILSGRRRADVKNRVGVPGLSYLGLHGWEGPKTATAKASAAQRLLRQAQRQFEPELARVPGIWIEEKGLILAVHARGAPARAVQRAGVIVDRLMKPFKPHLRLLSGNKVWEIIPQELKGKGAAVRALLREMPAATLPIYVGDDTTDESAFAALRRGITVRAGPRRPTRARFGLRGPQEVRRFLEKVERALGEIERPTRPTRQRTGSASAAHLSLEREASARFPRGYALPGGDGGSRPAVAT